MINPFEKQRTATKEGFTEKMEVPDEIMKDIDLVLNNLLQSKDRGRGIDVNQQCLDRFGITWKEVQQEMHKRIINAKFELLPATAKRESLNANLEYRALLRTLHEFTGNWITKRFIEALYLNYSKRFEGSSVVSNVERLKRKDYDQTIGEKELLLLEIAPVMNPERVEEVLRDYDTELVSE